jgi:xanthine dehydrogenase accessory factor
MLVTTAKVIGTIGGGNLEFKAIGIARDMLVAGGASMIRRFPLGASLGQCCGGLVNLLFEPVAPATYWPGALARAIGGGESCVLVTDLHGEDNAGKLLIGGDATGADAQKSSHAALREAATKRQPNNCVEVVAVEDRAYLVETVGPTALHLYLFGAGHVGRALVKIMGDLDCRITWVDSREQEFPDNVPANTACLVSEDPADTIDSASPGAYFLVMTHSHALDQAIAESILRRGDYAWFGLIGSATKRRLFEKRLAGRGISNDRLATMTCPIGLPQVAAKEPMAIALGVAAQLLQHSELRKRNSRSVASSILQTPAIAGGSRQKPAATRSGA